MGVFYCGLGKKQRAERAEIRDKREERRKKQVGGRLVNGKQADR
jgi:hypothetical protein